MSDLARQWTQNEGVVIEISEKSAWSRRLSGLLYSQECPGEAERMSIFPRGLDFSCLSLPEIR